MCTSLIGSYLGGGADMLLAALAGVASMGIAGEVAYERLNKESEGTGTLKTKMIDVLYNLSDELILKRVKISEE
jgi:hydroxyethylthiazole kinase